MYMYIYIHIHTHNITWIDRYKQIDRLWLSNWLSSKESTTKQEKQVWSLGQEDPQKKEMAIHSNILIWELPWTEDPGRL